MKMLPKISRLIASGESETLDFKQTISDASKISKTLTAFANHKGGTLLIGVRDNGSISGIQSEDERYMLELAASLYCSPQIELEITEHELNRKTVLEARVKPVPGRLHFSKDENERWWVYHRVNDKTIQASAVMFQVLKKQNRESDSLSQYSFLESEILRSLGSANDLSLSDLIKNLNIKKNRIIYSLAKLIHFDLIRVNYNQKLETYSLKA